jgi:hypothetical protein
MIPRGGAFSAVHPEIRRGAPLRNGLVQVSPFWPNGGPKASKGRIKRNAIGIFQRTMELVDRMFDDK